MRRGLRLFSVLTAVSLITFGDPPDRDRVADTVAALNAPAFKERQQAKADLEQWGGAFPRYMLTLLVEEFRKTDQPEVLHQLEGLLTGLASRVLFFQPKAFLGVTFELRMLPDGRNTIHLQTVIPGSPADRSGLRTGDHLLEVGGTSVEEFRDPSEFARIIQDQLPLEKIPLRVLRNRKEFNTDVFLTVSELSVQQMNQRLAEEEAKVRAWLKSLREDKAGSGDFPVGTFRMGS